MHLQISLSDAVSKTVHRGSVIRRGYSGLASTGYIHEIVRQSEEVGEDLLPDGHRAASLLKRWLLGTHQGAVTREHLDYYLD